MSTAAPPGLLRPDVQPEVLGMIGTAGHVDHGKTLLVKMLTGCQTDRLKEEQERGLTIELGFAPCFLGDNLCVGIVDVPGHERFVRTMVAGVSGIDLTILVIAADDGIMPQTVEHLQIMDLLGVRHGLVALTKTDLVSPGQVAERTAEIAGFLHGTFLENAPICPVSSANGDGYGAFYEQLVARIRALRRRSAAGVFRMPVERVFSQAGFGEVVSGIPVSGRIRTGDPVALTPGGGPAGRVRGLQCFGRDAAAGSAGQCLALNVPEWGKPAPQRGQVIVPPGHLPPATLFYVRLHAVPRLDSPLKHAEEVRFHTGTAEAHGKLFLLENQTVSGGEAALATILTAEPVAAASGDRFILRRPSPMATIAGGRIRLAESPVERPRRPDMLARLRDWEAFFQDVEEDTDAALARRLEYAVRGHGARGSGVAEAARETLLPAAEAAPMIAALRQAGRLLEPKPGTLVQTGVFRDCLAELERRLAGARAGGRLNIPVNECRQGLDWSPAVWSAACRELERAGRFALQGESILLQTSLDELPEADRALADRLLRLYEETGYHSPRPDELAAALAVPDAAAGRMLDFLVRQRRLVRVADHVILADSHYRAAQAYVVETIQRDGVLLSPAFRDQLATTRKYAMSILDFMDLRRITVRAGNDRRLMPGYERNLL